MSTWRPTSDLPKWLTWLPRWSHVPVKWAFRLALLGAIVALVVSLFYLILAARFDLDEVAAMPARTTLLDRQGAPIEVSWGSARHLARRQDLPEFLVSSLEAREDERFFEHPGIDVRGLARATFRNIKDWNFTQGASTLTMQLARNTYEMRAKSIHRKLLEIALTLRIEQRYSKDEILTHYLNRIYFGAGCHGVEEAARTYFGKSVSELHEGECSMLIGIIRGPHVFSPIRNMKGARAQQSETLNRLITMGRIDAGEKVRIQELPIKLVPEEQRTNERSYALKAIRSELSTLLDVSDIRADGLVVHTSLDTGWQLRLETALSEELLRLEGTPSWDHPVHAEHEPGDTPAYVQSAAVTLDSDTGEILALVGGRDFLDSRYDRSTGARRDLGTLFEPWIAAAASERGKRVLPGKPVLTGRQIGPIETARIAQRCGLGGPFLETDDLFRGSAASTPMETATALTTLANGGKRAVPHFITMIQDATGSTLFTREPEISQAISKNAAKQACSLFHQVGGSRCFHGSTGSDRDAWVLRIGPSGSTVIWIGFDNPEHIATDARLDQVLEHLEKELGE